MTAAAACKTESRAPLLSTRRPSSNQQVRPVPVPRPLGAVPQCTHPGHPAPGRASSPRPRTPLDRGGDRARSADQREMAEGLREVANLALAAHVVLLGKQSEVVAQSQQPLEQRACLLDTPI